MWKVLVGVAASLRADAQAHADLDFPNITNPAGLDLVSHAANGSVESIVVILNKAPAVSVGQEPETFGFRPCWGDRLFNDDVGTGGEAIRDDANVGVWRSQYVDHVGRHLGEHFSVISKRFGSIEADRSVLSECGRKVAHA
jgi:hypothetical protein